MSKINLSIDKNYCAAWGAFEGIRELVQNAKDADEDGYTMSIEHFPRSNRLEIVTEKIMVDPAKLLILGKSDKSPGEKRGQFGEGFVLGTLALIRKGHDVKFQNNDLSWTVSFEVAEEGHPFAGHELLTFKSRTLKVREANFKVEVDNITTDIWNALKKLFLFLTPPKASDMVETREGTLLLEEERKGQVFSRGIFVRTFEDLACGYDIKHLDLDRDRKMVDEWQLHYRLGRLWEDANAQQPALFASRIYAMAKAGAAETKQLKYHADEKLLKSIRDQFVEEHGDNAAPVMSMTAAKTAEAAGATPIVVAETLKELLDKGGLSAESVARRIESTVERRLSPHEFTSEEERNIDRIAPLLPEMAIVAFRGTVPTCRLIDDGKRVGVDARLLSGPFKVLLSAAVGVEAQRRNISTTDLLIEYVAGSEPPAYPSSREETEAEAAQQRLCEVHERGGSPSLG